MHIFKHCTINNFPNYKISVSGPRCKRFQGDKRGQGDEKDAGRDKTDERVPGKHHKITREEVKYLPQNHYKTLPVQ